MLTECILISSIWNSKVRVSCNSPHDRAFSSITYDPVDTSRCKSGSLNEIPLALKEDDGGPSEDIIFHPVSVGLGAVSAFKVFEGSTTTQALRTPITLILRPVQELP